MSFRKWFKKKQRLDDTKFVDEEVVHTNGDTRPSSAFNNAAKTVKQNGASVVKKTVKFDSINGNHLDNDGIYNKNDLLPLETALLLIADEQPLVARSTPRGQPTIDNHWAEEREMRYCLYDKPVYDAMIKNSLRTVELLQENLDDFVTEVRKSPISRDTTPRPI